MIARSYQIYRQLKPAVSREALIDVLRGLWKYIYRTTQTFHKQQNQDLVDQEYMGLSLEVLYTLQVRPYPRSIIFHSFIRSIVSNFIYLESRSL